MTNIRTYYQADAHELLFGFERTLTAEDFDDYQLEMIKLFFRHEAVIVAGFMGSGKTSTSLYAACQLMHAKKVSRTLVVAPLNVAKDTWPDEILSWSFSRRFSYSVVVGTEEERREALRRPAHIHIVNRENYKWLMKTVGFKRWPWDLLIYDEVTRLKGGQLRGPGGNKDGKAHTGAEFRYMMKSRKLFKRVWGLTGSPATEGLKDWWGPIYLLDYGARLGSSKTKFMEKWFSYNQYNYKHIPFDHSEGEILDRISDIVFCFKEEDYIDLPPLVVKDRWVHLEPRHMKAYQKFKRTFVLDELDIEAVNSAVLVNKLCQFANGSVYSNVDSTEDPENHQKSKPEAKYVHSRKLMELESVFQEASGQPVLIAYSYKFDVHAIKKKFPWVRAFGETANDLRDWNEGKLRAMVLHPASAGHGLNFQLGGHILVWYGLCSSLELYVQMLKRLHRRGQKSGSVRVYRILAQGTHDGIVANSLAEKGVTQERMIDRLKVSLRK